MEYQLENAFYKLLSNAASGNYPPSDSIVFCAHLCCCRLTESHPASTPAHRCSTRLQRFGSLLFILLMSLLITSTVNGTDIAVLLSEDSIEFNEIILGIEDEIDETIIKIPIKPKDKSNMHTITKLLDTEKPNVIVLMGNKAIHAYHAFQQSEKNRNFPLSIAVAAVFVDQQIKVLKNTLGIQYETPIAASISGLRAIANQPIRRVGVIYSPRMKPIIEFNRAICALENIELVARELPNNKKPSPRQLKKYLKRLTADNIDALWVTNDTNLLSENLIINAWKPILSRYKKHVIVGLENLIKTPLKFGNLAVFPDHYELGIQTADIILQLKNEDWKSNTLEAEPPISIKKYFNLALTNQYRLSINTDRLNEFDKIIE